MDLERKMKNKKIWFLVASVIGLPVLAVLLLALPAVVLKMSCDACPRALWFVGMIAVLGLPTTIGIAISVTSLVLSTIAALLARRELSMSAFRKSMFLAYAVASGLSLAYGIWFNVTRQGDGMF